MGLLSTAAFCARCRFGVIRGNYTTAQMKKPVLSTGWRTLLSHLVLAHHLLNVMPAVVADTSVAVLSRTRRWTMGDSVMSTRRFKTNGENETAYIKTSAHRLVCCRQTSGFAQSAPKNKGNCCCLSTPLCSGFVFLCLLSFMRVL